MNRKGASAPEGFYRDWPELFFLVILVLGLLIAMVSRSLIIDYLIIFFSGMLVGRLWYNRRYNQRFPVFIISIGYLLGFIFGSLIVHKKADWGTIIALYIVGILVSNWLHKRGIFE